LAGSDGRGGIAQVHQTTVYLISQSAQTLELRIDEGANKVRREFGRRREIYKRRIEPKGEDSRHFFNSMWNAKSQYPYRFSPGRQRGYVPPKESMQAV
jgi:hypothetical protein